MGSREPTLFRLRRKRQSEPIDYLVVTRRGVGTLIPALETTSISKRIEFHGGSGTPTPPTAQVPSQLVFRRVETVSAAIASARRGRQFDVCFSSDAAGPITSGEGCLDPSTRSTQRPGASRLTPEATLSLSLQQHRSTARLARIRAVRKQRHAHAHAPAVLQGGLAAWEASRLSDHAASASPLSPEHQVQADFLRAHFSRGAGGSPTAGAAPAVLPPAFPAPGDPGVATARTGRTNAVAPPPTLAALQERAPRPPSLDAATRRELQKYMGMLEEACPEAARAVSTASMSEQEGGARPSEVGEDDDEVVDLFVLDESSAKATPGTESAAPAAPLVGTGAAEAAAGFGALLRGDRGEALRRAGARILDVEAIDGGWLRHVHAVAARAGELVDEVDSSSDGGAASSSDSNASSNPANDYGDASDDEEGGEASSVSGGSGGGDEDRAGDSTSEEVSSGEDEDNGAVPSAKRQGPRRAAIGGGIPSTEDEVAVTAFLAARAGRGIAGRAGVIDEEDRASASVPHWARAPFAKSPPVRAHDRGTSHHRRGGSYENEEDEDESYGYTNSGEEEEDKENDEEQSEKDDEDDDDRRPQRQSRALDPAPLLGPRQRALLSKIAQGTHHTRRRSHRVDDGGDWSGSDYGGDYHDEYCDRVRPGERIDPETGTVVANAAAAAAAANEEGSNTFDSVPPPMSLLNYARARAAILAEEHEQPSG